MVGLTRHEVVLAALCLVGVHVRLAVGALFCHCRCSVICFVYFTFNSLLQLRKNPDCSKGSMHKIGCSRSYQVESLVVWQRLGRGEHFLLFPFSLLMFPTPIAMCPAINMPTSEGISGLSFFGSYPLAKGIHDLHEHI